jgi:hypothetical protein
MTSPRQLAVVIWCGAAQIAERPWPPWKMNRVWINTHSLEFDADNVQSKNLLNLNHYQLSISPPMPCDNDIPVSDNHISTYI